MPKTLDGGQPSSALAGAMIVAGSHLAADTDSDGLANVGGETSDDSNKKQKTITPRSADQAAAVEQPRRTQ